MKKLLIILLLLPIFCNAQDKYSYTLGDGTVVHRVMESSTYNYPITHCDTQKVLMLVSEVVGNHTVYSIDGYTVHTYLEYPFYTQNESFEYFFGSTPKNMYKIPEGKVIWECRNIK